MMTGRLYIDGNDAYSSYGVYVVNGGWNDLIAYPPLKPFNSNDWQEFDGLDADLSEQVLNAREVSIKITYNNEYKRFIELVDLLQDGGYHTFNFASIGRTYELRLLSLSGFRASEDLEIVTMKFSEDLPMSGYTYQVPTSTIPPTNEYTIDGNPLTRYGVRVLKGSLAEILKTANIKPYLTTDVKTKSGVTYDAHKIKYKSKDVKLYCLMRAESLTKLWRNYDALLYDLIRPEARTLGVERIEKEFKFAYKSCQVVEFFPTGKLWLHFILTIIFI